jgi:C1A family cysteine protease
MMGILVFASWMESAAAMASGKIPQPRARDQIVGGHAIALSGWDDASRVFTFRNSWGSRVGKNGVFQIPYDYVCNPNYAGDAWVVV